MPRALAEHVGLLDAWEGWKAEHEDMQAQLDRANERRDQKVEAIFAECGEHVRKKYRSQGTDRLIRDYEAGLLTPQATPHR